MIENIITEVPSASIHIITYFNIHPKEWLFHSNKTDGDGRDFFIAY